MDKNVCEGNLIFYLFIFSVIHKDQRNVNMTRKSLVSFDTKYLLREQQSCQGKVLLKGESAVN